jgi:hypothetical protein
LELIGLILLTLIAFEVFFCSFLEMFQMDFSALIDSVHWSLDAGSNNWLQYPCLPESSFQLDGGSSVHPVPTRMEDVQVAPEFDLPDQDLFDLDLDLVVASFASTSESSASPQPTAESGMAGLEGASNWYSSSPSSTSSSDLVSMAINQAAVFQDFQWMETEDTSSCSPAPSVAEEHSAASGIIITPPQPLPFTWTVPDQGFAVDRQSAGFDFKIPEGKKKNGKYVKAAPWTFSELMNKLFVDKEKTCPVDFRTTIPAQLQGQFRVVVYVSFAGLQDVHEPVRPCRTHSRNDPEKPLMSCNHPGAKAEIRDRQNAAVFPLDGNNAGQLSAAAGFTFTCWNTCPSLKNKKNQIRPLKLHFRLETRSGQMVDEKAVDLKLCSCPGRDIKTEEGRFT